MEHLRRSPRQLALGTLLVLLWPSGAFAGAGNEDCRYPDSLTPAQRVALCEQDPARRLEQDLGVPAVLAPRFVQLAVRNRAQTRRSLPFQEVPEAEMRALEFELLDLLRQAPDLAAVREEVRSFYSRQKLRPSQALLDFVARSLEPERLALALVDSRHGAWSPSQAWILAVALRLHPDQPALWLREAALVGDTSPWRFAFQEEALRLLDANQGDAAVIVAAQLLQMEIQAGLGARMLESWQGLPEGLRARLLAADGKRLRSEIGGLTLVADVPDLHFDLVAAHLLASDTRGAAEAEAALPPAPAESPAPWLSSYAYAREEWTAHNLRLRRSLFALWLRPSPDDPFPMLTEIASPWVRAASVDSLLLLGRLAEREGYPAIANFAYSDIWARPEKTELRSDLPPGLPERVVVRILRTQADLAELHREVLERAGATGRAVPPIIEPAVRAVERLVEPHTRSLAPSFTSGWHMVLFVVDRSGQRAFVIWAGSSQGGQLRLEESGDVWSGISVGHWIA